MENSFSFLSLFWAIELTALALIVFICLLIYQLRQATLLLKRVDEKVSEISLKHSEEDDFFNIEKVEKWFEKGDIKSLKQYCECFIKENPNSVQANWYYALGQYNQGDYGLAKKYFEKVISLNPLWREGAIVYLQEIADKSGQKDFKTLH